jgi:hypothetical protein
MYRISKAFVFLNTVERKASLLWSEYFSSNKEEGV